MSIQIRGARIAEDREPFIGKGEREIGRQRKGLREVSNIPAHVTKKIADLKLTSNSLQNNSEKQKLLKNGGTSNIPKNCFQKALPVEKPVKKLELKPTKRDLIEDIDKLHEGNVFLVSEYAKDVYYYLMHLECKFSINKWPLENSKITPGMRTILVDWLVDVHVEYHLLQETIHTAVAILDRYLQTEDALNTKVFQLVGVSALSLASKYEEMIAPVIDDFLYLCKNAYQRKELIEMEVKMLKALNFDLGRPVSVVFLRRYNMAAKADKLQHCYSKFFIDLVLLDSKFSHIRPSLIAASAAYIAMCVIKNTTGSSLWTSTLVHYSSYTFQQMIEVASQVATMIIASTKSKYDSVKRKYADSSFLGVSLKIVTSLEILKKIASNSPVAASN